ncbi:MAG: peptidase U32 [Desulfobulbus propionicus]|nr:MAG: peptidase U32 [Desulfobulbus propionicus]
MKIPELLAPAGSFEKLVTAVHYGADAVYLGGRLFSLRARAGNFDYEGIDRAVQYAHQHNVKVYVTVNIFAHNNDLAEMEAYLRELQDLQVDGIIVADPGVLAIAQKVTPKLPVHLSTQANVTNAASAAFWSAQGVSRLNLARELGYKEMKEIRVQVDTELEIFVHGALCISYSGRCMLSNYMTGRDANKGDCAHPCRYSYKLVEEKRPGEYFPVEEDERGTYIFNSKDLCLLPRLPKLLEVGADSLKIEGRMKSMGYVGSVVRLYRTALDWIKEQLFLGNTLENMVLPEIFHNEINKIGTRGATENFFESHPSSEDMLYDTMRIAQGFAPAGIVREVSPLVIEARNVLEKGDTVEYLPTDTIEPITVQVVNMVGRDGVDVQRANPGNIVRLQTEPKIPGVEKNSIVRKNIAPL